MTTPVAPSTIRAYQNIPQINRHQNDYFCENGTRVCIPLYIDITTSLRKEILNAIRELANTPIEATQQPDSITGISVVSYSTHKPDIEAYLGMTIDNLRSVLFSRGGLEVSLALKLQQVSGLDVVSDKDFTAAFKERQALVKNFQKEHPFVRPALGA